MKVIACAFSNCPKCGDLGCLEYYSEIEWNFRCECGHKESNVK